MNCSTGRQSPQKMLNVIKMTNVLFPPAGSTDLASLQRAQACCRGILQFVNEVVRETEQRQRLSQYQRRLDAAPQFKVDKSSFILFFFSVLALFFNFFQNRV